MAMAKAKQETIDAAIEQRKARVKALLTEVGCTRLDYVRWSPHKECIEVYFYSALCLYPSNNGRYAIYVYVKHDEQPLIATEIIEETKQAEIARGVLNAWRAKEQEQAS